jgi:hypothetical protein
VLSGCADEFDCATCTVPSQWGRLGPLNSHAWKTYQAVSTRLTGDTSAAGSVLVKLLEDLDSDEFADAWARLSVIHDVLCPKKDRKER